MPNLRLLKAPRFPLRLTRHSAKGFYHASPRLRDEAEASRPSTAPKIAIDIKHIRNNPELHKQNCLDRNYNAAAQAPQKIIGLYAQWHEHQREGRSLRERNNRLKLQLANPAAFTEDTEEASEIKALSKEQIIEEARTLKEKISTIEEKEVLLKTEIDDLAATLPNLTSDETPRGIEPKVLGYINQRPPTRPSPSHTEIGTRLNILDFPSATNTSGYGFYYLLGTGALLEQALLPYAQSICLSRGWSLVTPPSMVYSHIASACGFQPRDQGGESQIYRIAQSEAEKGRRPEYCLAGTAEIPLAGMMANRTMAEGELPMKSVAMSRCYRREAGGRGRDTKGLYRVHEFSKLEMFGWTSPSYTAAVEVFDEMLSIQTEVLSSLGLHCRILEMPSTDLGASAMRKKDIEVFFPSRRSSTTGNSNGEEGNGKEEEWGEVTSTSICGDYQSRRLGTRTSLRERGGKLDWVWTVNGTAMAVPRVWAAVVECGWDEEAQVVRLPKCLWPFMGGREVIGLE